MIRLGVAIATTLVLVCGAGATADPPLTAAEVMAEARDELLGRIRAAAAPVALGPAAVPGAVASIPLSTPVDDTPDPVATAALEPGSTTTLDAGDVGLSAVFSGHDIPGPLSLAAGEPAAKDTAVRAAERETSGAVVSDLVEIVATEDDGSRVTSFPAELIDRRPERTTGTPVHDVIPGISLAMDVDEERLTATGVDPSTLRIYTRHDPGEPWTMLPSYFDEASGEVKGESDHLSQFVVIGVPFTPAPGPRIVLDPDDDDGSVRTPAPASEYPYNWDLVDGVRRILQQRCLADVVVTRTADAKHVSRDTRAAIAAAADPAVTVGFGFNALRGQAWGTERTGGTLAFSRGHADDDALVQQFVDHLPEYTGRPAKRSPRTRDFPFREYESLPGAYAHIETLFMDHNFDRPVIDHGFGGIVDGTFRSLGGYLESKGFDCTDPATGGWPAPPSQAELARWRHLGYQNHQVYGADPVSFATGNLVEAVPLFSLSGAGEQSLEATLVYNSQDGRLSRVGAGWSFGLGARAQRFSDGSVLVVRGDGASSVFIADGRGGFSSSDDPDISLDEDGGGRLRLTDRGGASWVFDAGDEEGIGELVRFTDRFGAATTLTYGAPDPDVQHFVPLTSVTDASGQTVSIENDARGRITAFVLPDGRTWRLTYDAAGDLIAVTDAGGGIRSLTYDDAHRMLTATDPEGTLYLVNTYDEDGRVVAQRDADGNERTFSYEQGRTVYTDNEGRRTVFGVDDRFRVTSVENPDGTTAVWRYDARDDVVAHVDEAGREERYAYDDAGNLATETDAAGNETRYTSTSTGQVASRTDALGRIWTHEYDGRGLLTRELRPDGTAMQYAYTSAGDLASATAPSGAASTYEYDGRGNVVAATDPLGHRTTFAYDAGNRLTSVVDPIGSTTTYEWDHADRLTAITDPMGARSTFAYDRNGNLRSATDAADAVTTYEWDALSRVVRSVAPDGGVTTFSYDREDHLTSATDPEGATTQLLLDQAYRAAGVIDPNGARWEQELDATGIVTGMTDADGARTTVELDEVGRAVETTDPTGAATSVVYDAVGRVASEKDAAGAETRFEYDALDRLTRATDPAGHASEFHYDADGNLVGTVDRLGNPTLFEVDAAGQVLSATDATGAVERYEYDAAGRVTAVIDADGGRTAFTYDAAGRTTAVTDPLGAETRYGYDAVGRQVSATDPLGAVTSRLRRCRASHPCRRRSRRRTPHRLRPGRPAYVDHR